MSQSDDGKSTSESEFEVVDPNNLRFGVGSGSSYGTSDEPTSEEQTEEPTTDEEDLEILNQYLVFWRTESSSYSSKHCFAEPYQFQWGNHSFAQQNKPPSGIFFFHKQKVNKPSASAASSNHQQPREALTVKAYLDSQVPTAAAVGFSAPGFLPAAEPRVVSPGATLPKSRLTAQHIDIVGLEEEALMAPLHHSSVSEGSGCDEGDFQVVNCFAKEAEPANQLPPMSIFCNQCGLLFSECDCTVNIAPVISAQQTPKNAVEPDGAAPAISPKNHDFFFIKERSMSADAQAQLMNDYMYNERSFLSTTNVPRFSVLTDYSRTDSSHAPCAPEESVTRTQQPAPRLATFIDVDILGRGSSDGERSDEEDTAAHNPNRWVSRFPLIILLFFCIIAVL
eukprot:CAMPEP_0175126302 /NCGR_PEP_ID=MMETSP0087-20121206/3773_1 /TAXON_ID=136419 /ORGANISM="Unknown Unknown, Strain D1" /LENGTH=393 /DNA_ID=CAMNT_0016408189 /DNA_START=53 /DNA_END=1232 /DNA_ORIENTATION=+